MIVARGLFCSTCLGCPLNSYVLIGNLNYQGRRVQFTSIFSSRVFKFPERVFWTFRVEKISTGSDLKTLPSNFIAVFMK